MPDKKPPSNAPAKPDAGGGERPIAREKTLKSKLYMEPIILGRELLTLDAIRDVVYRGRQIEVHADALVDVERAAQFVGEQAKAGRVIYGVTTGFGANSNTLIAPADMTKLQEKLLLSHACGVGDPFPEEVVRAMICMRINGLLTMHSGARATTVLALASMLNARVHPIIPSQGSVGASGDLCPLAHMGLPLLGLGEVLVDGLRLEGAKGLEICGLAPITLTYKEGIALLNGTQAQTALAFCATHRLRRLADMADAVCAMSLEALCGRGNAFDARLHALRRRAGQMESAAAIRRWTEGSELVDRDPDLMPYKRDRIQDPYSIRCAPQVHGACRDVLAHVEDVVLQESNAVTDNPILFPDDGDIISGGNFHGEPVAMAIDYLKLAIAELANISDRRCFKLLSPELSEGLPAFLVDKPGLDSGLMIAQYVTASLVSDNKVLAHPASVDSIPTSGNKEDHVAMGAQAGVQAFRMLDNSERVIAIELIIAAQALDLRMRLDNARPGFRIAALHKAVREISPFIHQDRRMSFEIEAVASDLVRRDGKPPGWEL